MMLFLSLAFFAIAQPATAGKTSCALHGAGAIDHVADAAIDIWAASKRCGKDGEAVKCEIDITSAAEAVGNMANTIVSAAAECGAIDTSKSGCGQLVGHLLATTAGLASKVGEVMHRCPGKFNAGADHTILDRDTRLGKCVINAKDTLKSVFNIAHGMSHIGDDEDKEVAGAGVVTDFGAYLAESFHQCEAYDNKGNEDAACAASILGMISELDRVGEIGEQMSHVCEPSDEDKARLYAREGQKVASTGTNSMNLLLAAFLPITMIVSFAMGRRYAKNHAQNNAREVTEADEELLQ